MAAQKACARREHTAVDKSQLSTVNSFNVAALSKDRWQRERERENERKRERERERERERKDE